MDCPFCSIEPGERLLENDLVIARYDHFPVSPGHVLLVTRRHVATWFEASDEERDALTRAIADAVAIIEARPGAKPDGYNIGMNVGQAAGQTVMHLHLHVIPRGEAVAHADESEGCDGAGWQGGRVKRPQT